MYVLMFLQVFQTFQQFTMIPSCGKKR